MDKLSVIITTHEANSTDKGRMKKNTKSKSKKNTAPQYGSEFDIASLVRDLGGRTRIPGALREHGIADDVNEAKVDKWLHRNSMPADQLGNLLLLAQLEYRPVNIYRYIKDVRQ